MPDFTAQTPRAALRASLETLRTQFSDGATKYPWFQHVLATGPIDHTEFPCIDRHIIPEHLAIQDSFDVTTTDCTPQLYHETMDRWDDRCFAGLVAWYWCRRDHIGQKVVDAQERIECAKCAQLFEPLARQTARLLLDSGLEGEVSQWRQRDTGGHKYWLWFLHKTLKPEPIVVGPYQFSLINNLFLASALTIDTMIAAAEGSNAGRDLPEADTKVDADNGQPAEPANDSTTGKKPKRSTERGEGRAKLKKPASAKAPWHTFTTGIAGFRWKP